MKERDAGAAGTRAPSVSLSVVIFIISTALIAVASLYLFDERFVTLSYGLPLLICLWQKDKLLLWSMVTAFVFVATLRALAIMPGASGSYYMGWLHWGMEVINLLLIATAVHVTIGLTARLELKNEELAEFNRNLDAVARFPEENPHPVMRLDQDGRVIYANPAAERILIDTGSQAGEAAPGELQAAARRALKRGQLLEVDFFCCGGSTILFTAVPVLSGGYANLYGRDVTQERRAATALRQSEEMFRGTFENAAVGVSHIDAAGRLLRSNQYLQDLMDFSQEDLTATGFLDLTRPDERESERKLYDELVRGDLNSYSLEKRYVRKDGSERWVLVTRSAQRDDNGNFLYSINIVQDISKRKAAEEKLSRYELLANNARDIILFMRLDDGRILEANAAAEKAYGYSREEFLGLTIYDIRADSSLRFTSEQMSAAYEKGILFETRHWRKDGSVFPVEVSSRGAMVGGVPTLISVVRDTTERKRADEALRRSEEDARARAAELQDLTNELARSNQDLERFAYVVSHDLQEPLRQIVGFADLIGRRYGQALDVEGRDFVGFMIEGGKRMQDLIRGLLAFSRVGRAKTARKPTRMNEVVDSALFNLQLTVQQSGATVTQEPMPELTVDRVQFVQVFQNLIGNSLKFHGADTPVIHIGGRQQEGEWLFFVRDNGIGFEAKDAEKLFLPFQRLHLRRDYEGTGIGLAICKRIVDLHGGRIWAESQPGQGATFYFTLPAA